MIDPAKIETNQTIKLHTTAKKSLLLICGSGVFVLIGLCMLMDGEPAGWLCVIFFGTGVIAGTLLLLPGCSYLEIAPDGFTMCSLFRKHFYSWREVQDFGAGSIAGNEMVFFNFSNDYAKSRAGRRLSAAVSGAEGALPDTYGMSAVDLAELMAVYRDRCYLAGADK